MEISKKPRRIAQATVLIFAGALVALAWCWPWPPVQAEEKIPAKCSLSQIIEGSGRAILATGKARPRGTTTKLPLGGARTEYRRAGATPPGDESAGITLQGFKKDGTKFKNPFFALCMDTHDAKKRSLEEQAKLLKELGYDGAGHLWVEKVAERLKTLDAAGLKLFQIYIRAGIDPAQPPYDPRLKEILPLLKGRDAMLALLIVGGKPSDPAGDPRAVQIVGEIADMAREAGVRVALYPHSGDWLERVEDALRVVKKADRKNLGVMFNLCHWLKVDDEKNLRPLLEAAVPHLLAVTINGADRGAEIKAGKGQWIQPLDAGSFDIDGFLKTLKDLGYRGPIGLQCYGLPGDAREHLARSIAAWRKLCERLNAERDRP